MMLVGTNNSGTESAPNHLHPLSAFLCQMLSLNPSPSLQAHLSTLLPSILASISKPTHTSRPNTKQTHTTNPAAQRLK
jgi:hypothetical protein